MARILLASLFLAALATFTAASAINAHYTASAGVLGIRQDTSSEPTDADFTPCDNPDGSIPDTGYDSVLTAWDTHPSADQVGHHHYWPHDGDHHHHHGHHNGDDGTEPIRVSDDPVFYVAPGYGSCEFNYTNDDPGVCLAPGWIRSAHVNGCNKWVEVELPGLGTKSYARVLDACGAVKNTTFGCNDIYLTLSVFSALVQGNASIISAGRTPGPVRWRFTKEPCFGCWQGIPGNLPNGTPDDCTGADDNGLTRDGRKAGTEIVNATIAGEKCSGATTITSPQMAANVQTSLVETNPSAHFNADKFKQQLYAAFGDQTSSKRSTVKEARWHSGRAHTGRHQA